MTRVGWRKFRGYRLILILPCRENVVVCSRMMHRLFLVFTGALLGILGISCSQHVPLPPGAPPIVALSPIEGLPMASVWNEQNKLELGVDTGAVQKVLLFSPTVEELGGELRGKDTIQSTNLPISFSLNGEHIEETPDAVMVKTAPYDGLLGWAAIRQYIWNLNLPTGKHHFFTSLPSPIKRWNKLKLIKHSDYAQVDDPNGRTVIIDTGAPYALYIARKDWERFKQDYPDAPVSVYSGYSPAAGGYYAHECIYISSYRLGNLVLRDIVACESFADKDLLNTNSEIDIMLGLEAFFRREIWLDGPNHTVYFSEPRRRQYLSTPFNLSGITFVPEPDGTPPCRAVVAQWSIAWEAGLRTGDQLVSINGRRFLDYAVLDYITLHEGAKAKIVVQRNNTLITAEWVVPRLPSPGDYHPTPEAVSPEEYERLKPIHEQLDQLNNMLSQPFESDSPQNTHE